MDQGIELTQSNQGMRLSKSNQDIQLWQIAIYSTMTGGKTLNHDINTHNHGECVWVFSMKYEEED